MRSQIELKRSANQPIVSSRLDRHLNRLQLLEVRQLIAEGSVSPSNKIRRRNIQPTESNSDYDLSNRRSFKAWQAHTIDYTSIVAT